MKGGRVESHGQRQHSAVTQGKKVAAGGNQFGRDEGWRERRGEGTEKKRK